MKTHNWIIWSKNDCPWCDKAKALLTDKKLEYTEFLLGRDYNREELATKLPAGRPLTVPQIWYFNQYIGGYEDLQRYMEDHGILGVQN